MGKAGKSRNACAKRFKLTSTGKVVRRNACCGHLLSKKNAKRKRTLGNLQECSPSDVRALRAMLPSD